MGSLNRYQHAFIVDWQTKAPVVTPWKKEFVSVALDFSEVGQRDFCIRQHDMKNCPCCFNISLRWTLRVQPCEPIAKKMDMNHFLVHIITADQIQLPYVTFIQPTSAMCTRPDPWTSNHSMRRYVTFCLMLLTHAFDHLGGRFPPGGTCPM